MKLSICITSCNRLKYTKALLESLSDFYKNPSVEILVCDMWSTEEGLREYLQSLNQDGVIRFVGMPDDTPRDWINDEYIGRNKLLEESKGQYLMFLQDDSQYIGNAEILFAYLDDMEEIPNAKCLEIYSARKQTIASSMAGATPMMTKDGRKYWRRADRHYLTSGIYTRDVYEKIGKYPTDWPTERSYWGRSETWYSSKFKKLFPEGEIYRTHVPLMVSIWNDPRGGYAFIRENKRFGYYLSPIDESLYYEKNVSLDYVEEMNYKFDSPMSLIDCAKPIGWKMATLENGEPKKHPQWDTFENGPFEVLP